MRSKICLSFIIIFALSAIGMAPKPQSNDPKLEVLILPVGYGDCSLLKLPSGKYVMIDTGPAENADIILEELKTRQVVVIDLVVITHFHDNHYGGLRRLAAQFKIQTLAIPFGAPEPPDFTNVREQLMRRGTQVALLEKANQVDLEPEIEFEVLHPAGTVRDPNADSVVLWLRFRETTLLFPADITPEVQRQLIPDLKRLGKIDFVLLPHHGGDLDKKFAKRIGKAIKAASTGPSQWVSPAPATMERFDGELLRTDLHGRLLFRSDGHRIKKVDYA